MWKFFHWLAGIAVTLTLGLWLLFLRTRQAMMLTLAVTVTTITYHIGVRMLSGNLWNSRLHNHADYRNAWFRVTPREERLYRRLNVRRWKNKLPTWDPESFNRKTHSWDQLAQTTCQSELVHETNVVMSFLPLAAVHWVGGLPVFLATSLLAAAADALFVIMQRFNRSRIVRLIDRQQKRLSLA